MLLDPELTWLLCIILLYSVEASFTVRNSPSSRCSSSSSKYSISASINSTCSVQHHHHISAELSGLLYIMAPVSCVTAFVVLDVSGQEVFLCNDISQVHLLHFIVTGINNFLNGFPNVCSTTFVKHFFFLCLIFDSDSRNSDLGWIPGCRIVWPSQQKVMVYPVKQMSLMQDGQLLWRIICWSPFHMILCNFWQLYCRTNHYHICY